MIVHFGAIYRVEDKCNRPLMANLMNHYLISLKKRRRFQSILAESFKEERDADTKRSRYELWNRQQKSTLNVVDGNERKIIKK